MVRRARSLRPDLGTAQYCDSIHSCDISVAGPSGTGEARCWRVELRIRVFDENVRVATRAPAGSDPQQALSRALADTYAKASTRLKHIANSMVTAVVTVDKELQDASRRVPSARHQ